MRSIFTVLLGVLMAASVMAAGVSGDVRILFYGSDDYLVVIDGRTLPFTNSRIYLSNVRPGKHTIEVYRLKKNNRRENRPVYADRFVVRPQYDMNILIDPNGNVRFDEDRDRDNRKWNDRDRNNGQDDNDRYESDRNENGRYDRDEDRDRDRSWKNSDDGRYRSNSRYGNNNSNSRAMSDGNFSQLLQKIRSNYFSRMTTARDAVQNNYLYVRQLQQVLEVFPSDADRLNLAKLGYRNSADRRNYRQLSSLLSAQSGKELEKYIQEYR